MLTISLFWFGVLVLTCTVLGYLAGTTYSAYIRDSEYRRGAEDASEAMRGILVRVQQAHLDTLNNNNNNNNNDDNNDNQTKAQMGFDITQKGETK